MRAEQPSQTARKVALNVVSLGAKDGMDAVLPPGIVDATTELLVASGVVSQRAIKFARSQTAVDIYLAFDWMMPGQFEAFAYRKAFCERQVREGIKVGARQVLVLGAGYDTLGWRLAPEFSDVNFFEIDHPATAHLKAKGIEVMGRRANLHLIAEDLSQRRLSDVLQANATWDSTAPAVIVAEGLLMYLPPDAVATLFKQCAAVTGPGSRIAFTYIGQDSHGRPDVGPWTSLFLWILEVMGEPWLWTIHPNQLGPFLTANHWSIACEPLEFSDRSGIECYGVAVK